ncbi:carbohydrate metabolism regulator Tye7p [[Candida] anglica]|uniref:Carbohydrate metabolism regulator Tye7p n=1 Tax=[Candida] anglica TaxID=148631 RepID=A0ABP0EIW1_9ASCO
MFTNNWNICQENNLFDLNSAPLSPTNVGQGWDELLSKSAPMSLSTSADDLKMPQRPFATENPPIPEDLQCYFDNDSLFSNGEACTSSDTSRTNSPTVKAETRDDEHMIPPMFSSTLSHKLESIQKSNDLTPKSLESIFNTKDILKDDFSTIYTPTSRRSKSSSTVGGSSTSTYNPSGTITRTNSHPNISCTSSTSTINEIDNLAKPRVCKKRAPRKRLTDSQKQAHNKIEKKYRININAKIAGLQNIIPWVASEKTAFETGGNPVKEEPTEEFEVPCNRLNKSMILEKAIDYILHLQQEQKRANEEIAALRQEIQLLK